VKCPQPVGFEITDECLWNPSSPHSGKHAKGIQGASNPFDSGTIVLVG